MMGRLRLGTGHLGLKTAFYFQIDLQNCVDDLAEKVKEVLEQVQDQQHLKGDISQVPSWLVRQFSSWMSRYFSSWLAR